MATSVSASYSAGDMPHEKCRRSVYPNQSIPSLRRERTVIDGEFNRNQQLKPIYSNELPVRSSAFSGEKQYDRRQIPKKVRSAKSDEIFHLINRRLQTGVYGVRHMFRSNDPNQEGKLSKEAFRRVLMQLCGYINVEEWEKVCKMFHINERDDTITFQEFLSYFPDNDKARRELSLSQIDRHSSSLLTLSQNATSSQQSYHKHNLPKLTANYCFSLMKARCRDPSFTPNDYLPSDCLNDSIIIRDHLKKILENFQLDDIIHNENEFEKLWSKFDLNNSGIVRTNIFLRLLDYRINLADEIDANIQKLVTRSGAAGIVDRRISSSTGITNGSSPSRKQRQLSTNKNRDYYENDIQFKHTAPPPPTALDEPLNESIRPLIEQHINDNDGDENSNKISSSMNLSTRELSTKFRTLVQQHRKMIKQLNENDEFLPFLDRKVNEGYFCLKTVFSYLDSNQTNFITKQQLIVALHQFDIPLTLDNIDQFLQKHHCITTKTINNETMIDYNGFLKYFQDRSESSFLAHTLNIFSKEKSITTKSDFNNIENGIIDLLHHVFLSLTAAFKYISNDIDDLCPEKELFIILKKELNIADNYRFTEKQKNEVYNLLNCTDAMKQKRQLPYKRLLYLFSKTTIPINKERNIEKKEEKCIEKKEEKFIEKKKEEKSIEKKEEQKSLRKLSYIEKILNDLIRLRMHTFTKVFSRIDQPRTDKINKEQFYEVLQQMNTDLTQSEINMIWSSSGFHMDKSVPFANLIRQLIMFNRDENQAMLNQFQRSRSTHDHQISSTARSIISSSTRAISSSGGISDISNSGQSIDSHEIYNRILPYIRQNYNKITNKLLENDQTACGLIDFSTLQNIFHHYSVPINDIELGTLIRLDNPRNGSKIQYPFFIRKYHPDGPIIKISPWLRIHPIYEQLIQKQHAKHPIKEVYDQRTQNPRDLKYLIRLFNSYDKPRKDEKNLLLEMISNRASSSRSSFTEDESDHDENLYIIKKKVSSTRKKSYKKWIKDEDERLRDFINLNGGIKDWSRISKYVGNGRTDAQCQHRWERFLDPSITKGPWTDEEDKKVIELVRDYGARQWSLIAKELKGRVGKQCRERWHNHLNPAINKNPWTNDENLLLFILHQHFGNKWAEIAKYFNGRSDNSIKNHWNSSMKKKFELEVINLKSQGLEWTALIPPDFPWPKFDKSSSSRRPLNTITNRIQPSNTKRSSRTTTTTTTSSPAPINKIQIHSSIVNSDNDTKHHFYSTTDHNTLNVSSSHPLATVYSDHLQPISSSQTSSDVQQQECSSQELEHLFYCTPPSPVKQLPMLSSCADYTSSSQNSQTDHHISLFHNTLDYYPSHPPSRSSSLPVFTCSSSSSASSHSTILSNDTTNHNENRNIFTTDDTFTLNFNSQNEIKQENEHLLIDLTQSESNHDIVISPKTISNTSSPSKHRVLNTPERLDQPHRNHLTEQDWFNDFLAYPDPITTILSENHSSIRPTIVRRNKRLDKYQSTIIETKKRENFSKNLFNSSKKLKEELGYDPTYTEILIGQTRDQRYVTEQARRYLSCSSLNNYNS
ncbi:unnamed protein product [Rotaria sordida]|uniref:Uncharacterized protein n=1 Tax=Rotaria sordida TaxID=392033 RepID=A0A819F472_9BILA|nr:unnamed protein product [Rotaria sordida]